MSIMCQRQMPRRKRARPVAIYWSWRLRFHRTSYIRPGSRCVAHTEEWGPFSKADGIIEDVGDQRPHKARQFMVCRIAESVVSTNVAGGQHQPTGVATVERSRESAIRDPHACQVGRVEGLTHQVGSAVDCWSDKTLTLGHWQPPWRCFSTWRDKAGAWAETINRRATFWEPVRHLPLSSEHDPVVPSATII
jgi:hypothetical protein